MRISLPATVVMVTKAKMVSIKSFNLEKLISEAALELGIQNLKPKQCEAIPVSH